MEIFHKPKYQYFWKIHKAESYRGTVTPRYKKRDWSCRTLKPATMITQHHR
jgi:hypothetical protein